MPKKGYKQTEEHKKNLSKVMKVVKTGIKNPKHSKWMEKQKGSLSVNWKGGSSAWWARRLKKTYKECVLCKSKDKLEMHHKDGNHKNNERSNLIIICRKECHYFWHEYKE